MSALTRGLLQPSLPLLPTVLPGLVLVEQLLHLLLYGATLRQETAAMHFVLTRKLSLSILLCFSDGRIQFGALPSLYVWSVRK